MDRPGVFLSDDLPPVPLPWAREPSFGGHRSQGGSGFPCSPVGGGSVFSHPARDSGELLNFILYIVNSIWLTGFLSFVAQGGR